MRRFIAAGMIVLGFISWGSAIGVTALLAMSKLPLYLAAALPFFGLGGDILVVFGLALWGVPSLVNRRDKMIAAVRNFLQRFQRKS
jgi:hypothetical protein